MTLPIIDARSQPGRIGIETSPGQFDIRQYPANMDVQTTPARIDIQSHAPQLHTDSTRFWAALNGGTAKQLVDRIASQIPGIVLHNIEHIVEKGNRMASLNDRGPNPIPDIAYEDYRDRGTGLEYLGSPSYHSVDMEFIVQKPDIHIEPGGVTIRTSPHKPDIRYNRGNVRIYMEQYPKVTIIPPAIDMSV